MTYNRRVWERAQQETEAIRSTPEWQHAERLRRQHAERQAEQSKAVGCPITLPISEAASDILWL